MNILHVYKDYYPVLGGIENHVKILAEAQAAVGHQVIVLVCNRTARTDVETVNGVKVVKAGRWATVASMPLSLSQPLALARIRPDIVHLHSPYPLGEAANLWLGKGGATVITHHSDVVRQQGWLRLYGPILRRVLYAADQIIATSPRYIESSPWLRPLADKCTVIPLGVDTTRFSPAVKEQVGPPRLLFVGCLRYYKGLDTLLQALVDVPQAQLQVVGDGPMRQEWERLAENLGLADRVHFAGEVDGDELPTCYRQADLFVLPANARSEAFGTVLLEAMASGLPCVTTEVGTGTSWVVQDGVTGSVVSPQNPAALAQAIHQIIGNPAQRQQLAQASLQRARTEFSEEKMVSRVMALYEALVGKSKA